VGIVPNDKFLDSDFDFFSNDIGDDVLVTIDLTGSDTHTTQASLTVNDAPELNDWMDTMCSGIGGAAQDPVEVNFVLGESPVTKIPLISYEGLELEPPHSLMWEGATANLRRQCYRK